MSVIHVPDEKKVPALQALYRYAMVAFAARAFGTAGSDELTEERAEKALTWGYIDYLDGRCIKINVAGNDWNVGLYDRDAYMPARDALKDVL